MKCVVCGKPITYKFYLCDQCQVRYGHRQADRPEWLRFLIREEMRERKRVERGYYDREVPLETADDEKSHIEEWDNDRFP